MSTDKHRFQMLHCPIPDLHKDGVTLTFKGMNTEGKAMQFTATVSWNWIGQFTRRMARFWVKVDRPSRLEEIQRINNINKL
jgi:hypothetical protein